MLEVPEKFMLLAVNVPAPVIAFVLFELISQHPDNLTVVSVHTEIAEDVPEAN